jgi:homocysteine S-methyltransferase
MGPRNDAYKPESALPREAASVYHRWQAEQLAAAEPDCLAALTLPALSEAAGLADLMSEAGLPYLIGFVMRSDGRILDGTPLEQAMDVIDQSVSTPPLGYLATCVHPQTLKQAANTFTSEVCKRLIGIRANASSLNYEELDGAEKVVADEPELLAEAIADLQAQLQLQLVGGCCGTGPLHIEAIARTLGEGQ